MQKSKPSPAGAAAVAAPARQAADLECLLDRNPTPDQFGMELSRMFQVRPSEVALLRLEKGLLKFLFPEELKAAGSIPLSSSSAVAAHTAATKKVELFNSFAKVKHVSIFETVKLSGSEKNEEPRPSAIQKLMSAPVLDARGKVLGVVQICRKGHDWRSAGPDFTLNDLQRLELAAQTLAKAAFLQKSS